MTGSENERERESSGVTCSEAGNEERGSAAKQLAKRKYGNPDVPVKGKTLLVTNNERIRHSHACDRCRLKKVRCDGLKPSCSQCSKANFRCTTSDKLTRRGFPKGYTEMLELEVVRLQSMLDKGAGRQSAKDEVRLEEPKSRDREMGGCELVVSEPQFPFINDTFHYYDNFAYKENYLGHRTWDVLTGNRNVENAVTDAEVEILKNQQLLSIASLLQLQPSSLWLPRFLAVKCGDNLHGDVSAAVSRFNKTQNSLIPLLYPFDKWQAAFDQHLKAVEDPDPVNLLALLYVVQINWSCMDEFILFKVTKIICSSATNSLRNLQCLLLGCFYFMGAENHSAKSFASELLHLAFSMVLDLGLYVNSKKMTQLAKTTIKHEQRIVTFWTFQFLDSWWSLIQGFPKSNFVVDEFHPRAISSLEKPSLKPFHLLLDFTANSLDGCNLLHVLSSDNHNGRSKLIYLSESFRHLLVKWKLYHQLQDHEEQFNSEDSSVSLTMTKPDVIEIQLTLFYLAVTFLTEKNLKNKNVGTSHEGTNLEDAAFEILSLYYLLLLDNSQSGQPLQFTVLHILPCPNKELIDSCLTVLNDWAIQRQGDREFEGQWNGKYTKYQNFLMQWCQLYFEREPYDPMLIQLSLSYKIHLKQGKGLSKQRKRDYQQEVEQCSSRDALSRGRSKLLSSNSHAIMDQFDMFSHVNSPSLFINSIQNLPLSNQSPVNATQLNQNDNNNIIDMSNFKSQILIEHEETDEGYAEDDDEDEEEEEEESKPLEIPFASKRTGSLFQTKQNLPPSHRGQNLGSTANKRPNSDHNTIERKDYLTSNTPAHKRVRHDSQATANPEPSQNPPYSSNSSEVYRHYSANTPVRNLNTSNNHTIASDSHGEILPQPPLPSHGGLFDRSVKIGTTPCIDSGSANPNDNPQIVETPRAFADILLLHSSDQHRDMGNIKRRAIDNNNYTSASELYK